MAKFSRFVEAARQRRVGAAVAAGVRTEWFIKEVSDKVAMSMRNRVALATAMVKSKVFRNISQPVTKSGGRITDRSRPGEFPHADTTHLMKTIFSTVIQTSKGVYDGIVGTPLDYGLILETRKNRSFLTRTLNEERSKIQRILMGPIK